MTNLELSDSAGAKGKLPHHGRQNVTKQPEHCRACDKEKGSIQIGVESSLEQRNSTLVNGRLQTRQPALNERKPRKILKPKNEDYSTK